MLNGVNQAGQHNLSLNRSSTANDLAKRSFDLLVATGSLVITSPLFPLIAICVKLESKGPVFYVQERVGQHGESFNIYKFRSMHAPQDPSNQDPSKYDPDRITRVGWYLRKFTLDELPQLVNVIKGQMSVVGPRPLQRQCIDFSDPNFQRVLAVKPGLISKGSIEQRHSGYEMSNAEAARINAEYEAQRTFLKDLIVLLKSIAALWKGR
jgi:lipopolysaccharide/colanic/teichoic acid biosynthesis glycosyltransferase